MIPGVCGIGVLASVGVFGCGMSSNGMPDECDGGSVVRNTGMAGVPTTVSFANEIRPIFERNGCLTSACHGGGLISSGYNLETYAGVFGPGDEARALSTCDVAPGEPDASYLMEKLSEDNPRLGARMPLNRPPLNDADLELIRTWIAEGALEN